ncbi:MAG TPA: hypothetical protein VHB20_10260 [Verrucomicrobiae bacterium]|jgi:hypothetical protein|nr:hypothetical protein [Verrucomicrobiae bacterium]
MKTISQKTGLLFVAVCLPLAALASPGGVDNSFFLRGAINGQINAVVVDSQTNILIAGDFSSVYGHTYYGFAALHPDGSLNTALPEGFFPANVGRDVVALAIDSSQRIYVAGPNGVARLANSAQNWAVDLSYGGNQNGMINTIGTATSLAVRPLDSQLWVGTTTGLYSYDTGGGQTSCALPASFAGGHPYPSVTQVRYYPPSANENETSLEELAVAGIFGGALVSANGSANAGPFPGPAEASCIALRSGPGRLNCDGIHGDILVGGSFPWLFREGGVDSGTYFHAIDYYTNFPADNGYQISYIEQFDGGDALAIGTFSEIHSHPCNNLVHLLPDGTVDSTFANNLSFDGFAMAQQPDGNYIIVGGSLYTPVTGQAERIFAMAPPTAAAFTAPPPAQTTVYEGDTFCLGAGVSGQPAPSMEWLKDGHPLPSQTSASICVGNAGSGDAGSYQLQLTSFCGDPSVITSPSGAVTVLPAPTPPANDQFANAEVISGFDTNVTGTLRSATFEAGEPNHPGDADGRSVWWTWTAPASGPATFDVLGCDFAATLDIYTGSSINSLTLVTNNCQLSSDGEGGTFCNSLNLTCTFQATAGTTYAIAIGGTPNADSLGDIVLGLSAAGAPSGPTFISWNTIVTDTNVDYYAVASDGSNLMASGGSPSLFVSTDAFAWTPVPTSLDVDGALYSVNYDNGVFIAGADGLVENYRPGDSAATPHATTSGLTMNGSVYAQGLYVLTAADGTILTSVDATNWTEQATHTADDSFDWLYSVAYGHGVFVAVGDEGSVVTSTDATNWTLQTAEIGQNSGDSLYGVSYGNGVFVAVGEEGTVITSTDGTNWSLVPTPVVSQPDEDLFGVAFGAGRFVAVGDDGGIAISTDGVNWMLDNSGVTNLSLNAVTYYKDGQFVIVADAGTILVNHLPSFVPAIVKNGNITVTVTGLSGGTAVIEATPTLSPPQWTPLFTNAIVNGAVTFTEPVAGSAKFYRAIIH